jgi:hypothetical protein
MFGLSLGSSDTTERSNSAFNQRGASYGLTTFNPQGNAALQSLGTAYGNSGQAFMSALSGLSQTANQDTSAPNSSLLAALNSTAAIGQPQFQENLAAVRSRGYGGGMALDSKMQNQMLQDYQNQRQAALDQMVYADQQQRQQSKLAAGQALGSLSAQGNDFLKSLANQTTSTSQSGNQQTKSNSESSGTGFGFSL